MEPKLKEQKEKKLCEKGNFECFYRYSSNQDGAKKGTVIICPNAPCKYNKMKFGQHTRIIEYFIQSEQWDLAYYYFEDLLSMFHLQCDINEYYKLVREDKIDSDKLPLGCKIFAVSNKLYGLKNQLLKFQELEMSIKNKTISESISQKGKSDYNQQKSEFSKLFIENLERLKHMVMDGNTKRFDEDRGFGMSLQFLNKTIELAKKYGVDVKDTPNIVEEGFKKAAGLAGFNKDKEKQDKNIQKLKDAKMKALTERIAKEMKETGDISEETKKRMQELGDKSES